MYAHYRRNSLILEDIQFLSFWDFVRYPKFIRSTRPSDISFGMHANPFEMIGRFFLEESKEHNFL